MDRLDPMTATTATAVATTPAEPLHGMPGGLVFRSDLICPWSTVALLRLRRARAELGLDVGALEQTLEAGGARSAVLCQSRERNRSGVVVLPDGSEQLQPGARTRWIGTKLPQVVARVVSDDPSIVRELVARAAG